MPSPQIVLVPCLSDNYAVLLHDDETGTTLLIDAPEAGPIEDELGKRGWTLGHIFITHHHGDHVNGIAALKAAHGSHVVGPLSEADKIKGLDELVSEGDRVTAGPFSASVIATPGHTLGHIVYWFEGLKLLFSGDTMFAMGCGRLFEGSPAQMWDSLGKLAALPDDTVVYCGHEYTLSNARFAAGIETGNEALKDRIAEVERLRAEGRPTIPTTIGLEKATSPFVRAGEASVAAAVGMPGAPAGEVFAEVRRRKDNA